MIRRIGLAASAAILLSGTAFAGDFNVWGIQTFNPEADRYIGELVSEFGEANGVEAEYVVVPANVLNERLAAAFEGGAPPDVFMTVGQQIQYYMAQGLTIPVDDVLEDMKAVDGGIYENVVVQGVFEGEVQALPIELDVVPMYARTDLLEQAGHELPETWEEFRAAAKAIQEQNPMIASAGIAVSNANDAEGNLRTIIWSFGGHLFGEDGTTITFDSPETRAAYQFVADLFLEDRTLPRSALTWDDAGNNTAYQTGRAAFVINPPSIFAWLQENDQELLDNTQLIVIPKGPGPNGIHGSPASAWVWAASTDAGNHDLAKAWLRYFYEPERYQQVIESVGGRWLPIYRSMIDLPLFADVPQYAQFGEMAESGIVGGYKGPPSALSGEVFNAKLVTAVAQKILVDGDSVEDAVSWGQAEMEKLAAKH
jgi:multiple sugar transport system substrate-binding protein